MGLPPTKEKNPKPQNLGSTIVILIFYIFNYIIYLKCKKLLIFFFRFLGIILKNNTTKMFLKIVLQYFLK